MNTTLYGVRYNCADGKTEFNVGIMPVFAFDKGSAILKTRKKLKTLGAKKIRILDVANWFDAGTYLPGQCI